MPKNPTPLTPERARLWLGLNAWLQTRPFKRLHNIADAPTHLQTLLHEDNTQEQRHVGAVMRGALYFQARDDAATRIAYHAGDPETVARLEGQRAKLQALVARVLPLAETADLLHLLEVGSRSKWDDHFHREAAQHAARLAHSDAFEVRNHAQEVLRLTRAARRAVGLGG